jgi:hypothetical protein
VGGRRCVYTSLIGDYEALNEQPVAARSDIDFVCFTDNKNLTSSTWKIVTVNPIFQKDTVRSQRVIKLSPHEYLANYDLSLYIDNTVILSVKPEDIFAQYNGHSDFLVPSHSYRKSLLDEFIEVKERSLDDPKRIDEQLSDYRATDGNCLIERPYWSGILLRRHSKPEVQKVMRTWLQHVLRYARRDQLSANYAFRQAGLKPHRLDIDNYSSWFHTWPVSHNRRHNIRTYQVQRSFFEKALSRVRRTVHL